MFRASQFLNQESLKSIYFALINSYLSYANIVWASTCKTKLKTLASKQKHAIRIIFYADKFTHSKPLFKRVNALNIYQLNLSQVLNFMFKAKHNLTPRVFSARFLEIHHKYPTRFSEHNFLEPALATTRSKFSMSAREPHLWNHILNDNFIS